MKPVCSPIRAFFLPCFYFVSLCIFGINSTDIGANRFSRNVNFDPNKIEIFMDESALVNITFTKEELFPGGESIISLIFSVGKEDIITVNPQILTFRVEETEENTTITVYVHAEFIGHDYVQILWTSSEEKEPTEISNQLKVTVIREYGIIDDAFTYGVVTLLAIINVNIGAALHLPTVIKSLKRPIGPVIGFVCQFLIMPMLSFGFGKWILDDATMRLGLFTTGVSPGGGVSNILALMLNVNLDLSITMTTISTVAAFGMMPLWLFTLGKTIFDEAELKVPYLEVFAIALTLIVPLGIGLLLQKKLAKVAAFLVKILKPFATVLLVILSVSGAVSNLYLFKLLDWKNIVAGYCMTFFGYMIGGGIAIIFRQGWKNVLAIAIETGVQNTGLAIVALRTSLPQPEADIATVQPFIATIAMIVPSLIIFVIMKIFPKHFPENETREIDEIQESNIENPQKEKFTSITSD